MIKKLKSAGGAIATLFGFAASVAGIFAWMSITPEMFGQATYDIIRTWLPLIMFVFGAIFGAGVTSIVLNRMHRKKVAELESSHEKEIAELEASHANMVLELTRKDNRRKDRLYGLSPKQLLAIDRAIAEGGTVAVSCDSDIAREFQSIQRLGFANTPDNAPRGSYWFVSPDVTNAAREDDRFMGLLRDASFVGRFDDDGSFARYSTEEQEALRAAAE